MNRRHRNQSPAGRGAQRENTPRSRSAAERRQVREEIAQALVSVVENAGLYLENVQVSRGSRPIVSVTVDLPEGPGGVDSQQLVDISREISAVLDEIDVIAGAYQLEVTTPGTDRPLVEARHFSRAIGRLVKVTPREETPFTERLVAVEGDTLVFRGESGERRLSIGEVAKARVHIEFDRPKKD
ncbi:nus operon associated protein [Actinobaculum suis]|uniref:Ribosome maturation factor RimP n=1 Tax=Actinobaculum suis TaxID=1657 RepID=A0A0K9EV45_9ACTO|nr:ribosome maturation factor RimP [Actinobaculum suis]KMY24034.1 hypothetical protein ACU19_00530 [Actinobaculum suis]OCA95640.1 ribosome assembly cofactor RimP [Actinobaculum suis]OCA95841.1 ribosome assembly cofactor RimP [Actinobaculum suis]VDG76808.1 nus operon associated protein [Actinobaculum suis]